jgi:predicted permease
MKVQRRFRNYPAIGRLRPGVTLRAAQAEMTAIAAGLATAHPVESGGWTVLLEPFQDSLVRDARVTLLILLGGVTCVLLIAGANVAHLILMRADGRMRDTAVRMALGAGRARLARQWMTESTLLALTGGLAGFVVSAWAVPVLVAHAPLRLPRLDRITLDGRIFALSAALSVVIGMLSGLVAALGMRRVSVASLRTSAPFGGAERHGWMRSSLVIAQIGLAIVLLVGAGLVARTLMAVRDVGLGFDPSRALTFSVNLRAQYSDLDAARVFSHDLIDQLQAIPGVEAAGVGGVPLFGYMTDGFMAEGRDKPMEASVDVPSSGYFRALGIHLKAGRLFNDRDTAAAESVVIVNVAFARSAWNTDAAVGRRIRVSSPPGQPWMTVVGVVDDVRVSSLEADAPAVAYVPFDQSTILNYSNFVVRAAGEDTLRLVREAVRRVNPSVPLTHVATMDERVARLIAPRQFNLWLIGVFSAIALVLAVLGVYGLISETVARRTKEIALRIALGAGRQRVLRLIMGQMLAVAVTGTAVGLVVAALAARYLSSMLFGVTPLDPVTLTLVPVVFIGAAIAASVSPLRRAIHIDPIAALRGD